MKESAWSAILTWRAHDVPRMESVRVQLSGNRIKAYGRIVAAATPSHPAFSASYDLVTDEAGATKRLSLTVTLAERERQLSIARDEENMWLVQHHTGESKRAAYDGALDVDVIFSPFFNALPIRRTGLYQRNDSVTCPVVYVRLPELSVDPAVDQLQQRSRRDQTAFARRRDHDHGRRRRLHPRLPRAGRADLITPPARPAAASSSRQFSSPMTMVTISGLLKLS